MEEILSDCCEMFLRLLNHLRDTGQITQEEYEKMARHKVEFLEKVKVGVK